MLSSVSTRLITFMHDLGCAAPWALTLIQPRVEPGHHHRGTHNGRQFSILCCAALCCTNDCSQLYSTIFHTPSQIMDDSNVDDGDIARLLVRTVDLLKQIKWNAALLPHLQQPAKEALKGMDRKPIAEVLF